MVHEDPLSLPVSSMGAGQEAKKARQEAKGARQEAKRAKVHLLDSKYMLRGDPEVLQLAWIQPLNV